MVMVAPLRCALPPTVQYRPSAWEAEWRSTIAPLVQYDEPRNWTRGCVFMAQEVEHEVLPSVGERFARSPSVWIWSTTKDDKEHTLQGLMHAAMCADGGPVKTFLKERERERGWNSMEMIALPMLNGFQVLFIC